MRILLSILLLAIFIPTWSGEPRIPVFAAGARLSARLLDVPAGSRSGRLTWLAGWQLDSNDPAFGGISALAVAGRRFTLLSDGGNIVQFSLSDRGDVSDAVFGALPDGPGSGWRKEHRDSESLAIDPRTGRAWVGFEPSDNLRGSVWRYAPGFARAEIRTEPAGMRRWPVNGGAESLVALRSGHFVALGESARIPKSPVYRGLLFAGDPAVAGQRWYAFGYRSPIVGSRATDAAEMPNGDLVVLNRKVSLRSWFECSVTIVSRNELQPGAIVSGTLAGRIEAPWPKDNYEGIAVTREGDATILWIVSDDNESLVQRTLLLKFRLEPAPTPQRRR